MKTVRIIKDWEWPDLLGQTPGGTGIWEDVRFTEEPVTRCDYAVILNNLEREIQLDCPPENIWRVVQEPPTEIYRSWHENPSYAAKTFTCDPHLTDWQQGEKKNRLYEDHNVDSHVDSHVISHPMLPWHVNRDYDFLSTPFISAKQNRVSWITSTINLLEGHKKRMAFLDYISPRLPQLDLLGGSIRHIMNPVVKQKIETRQRELGFKHIADKWTGLAPYKYALAVENFSGPHYWTEKIADCFLTRTLPFYHGCTNLKDYFPAESFVRIDIDKPDEALDIIQRVLSEDPWQQRLPTLTEAAHLVLEKYQFFPHMTAFIRDSIQMNRHIPGSSKLLTLTPEPPKPGTVARQPKLTRENNPTPVPDNFIEFSQKKLNQRR